MNRGSYVTFVVLGLLMTLAPRHFPDFFPASGIDGSSARALWLEVMGGINMALGLAYAVMEAAAYLGSRRGAPEPSSARLRSESSAFPAAGHRVDLS